MHGIRVWATCLDQTYRKRCGGGTLPFICSYPSPSRARADAQGRRALDPSMFEKVSGVRKAMAPASPFRLCKYGRPAGRRHDGVKEFDIRIPYIQSFVE